jgi:hypothetical protein
MTTFVCNIHKSKFPLLAIHEPVAPCIETERAVDLLSISSLIQKSCFLWFTVVRRQSQRPGSRYRCFTFRHYDLLLDMLVRCTTAFPTLGTQIIGLANSDLVPCLASSLFLFSLLLFVAFSVIALFLESLKIFPLSESFRPAMLFEQASDLLFIGKLVSSMLCRIKSHLPLPLCPNMIVSHYTSSSRLWSLVQER